MALELRVPIDRLDASLYTDDGATKAVTLFLPPGADVEHLFDAGDPFLPVSEQGRVRLHARASLAAVAVRFSPETRPRPEDDFLTEQRALIVRLRGGAVIEGSLRHGTIAGKTRTADLLNEPSPSFALEADGILYFIAKAHVACVDEA